MQKFKIKILVISTMVLTPAFSLAEKLDFKSISENIYDNILTSIIDLLFVVAFVFFAWSTFRVVASDGDKRDEAKDTLFWGVIALFVMATAWGFVNILSETFFEGRLGGDGKEIFDKYDLNNNPTYNPDLGGKVGNNN